MAAEAQRRLAALAGDGALSPEALDALLDAYSREALLPARSAAPSAAGACLFLEALGQPLQSTVYSLQDALGKALVSCIGSLALEDCARLLGCLLARRAQPLHVGPLGERGAPGDVFAQTLQRVVALGAGGAAAVAGVLSTPEALQAVSPEAVAALPPPCRQLLWQAVPARCPCDLAHMLLQYDRATSGVLRELPHNFMNPGRSAAPPPPGAAAAAAPREDPCRDQRLRRRRAPAVQLLFESVRGSPACYAAACALLQRRFEETRDPKWCTLRADLFLLHAPPALPPLDACAPLILASEKFLGGGPPGALLEAVRALLRSAAPQPAGAKVREALLRAAEATLREAKKMKEKWRMPAGMAGGGRVEREWEGGGFCKPFGELGVPPALLAAYAGEIACPIDLRTMVKKAREFRYGSVEELRADMRLLAANCRAFNTPRETPDGARALFALVDRIGAELEGQLRAALGSSGGGGGVGGSVGAGSTSSAGVALPTLASHPHLVLQACMVLAEPTLSRALAQCASRALMSACASGAFALEAGGDYAALVALLAAGDLAHARSAGAALAAAGSSSSSSSSSSASASASASAASPGDFFALLAAALGEIVGGGGEAPDPQQQPQQPQQQPQSQPQPQQQQQLAFPPLPLALLTAALQRLFVDVELEAFTGQPGGPPALAPGAPAPSPGNLATTAALREVVQALQGGAHLHRRSIALLATCATLDCKLNPFLPSHLERVLLLCSLGVHPASGAVEPAMVRTLFTRLASALLKPPKGGAGCTGEAYLAPGAPPRACLERILRPALAAAGSGAARASPSAAALLHDLLADFLRFLFTQRAVEAGYALGLVREALGALAPPLAGAAWAATASAAPSLPRLLASGALQPGALAWTAPTFERARASYARLVSRHFPEFDWASVGLNAEALALGGGAGTASAGDAGSQRGDLTTSEGASDAGMG